jgi:hypothetical protein
MNNSLTYTPTARPGSHAVRQNMSASATPDVQVGVRCLLRVHRKARRGVNGCGDGCGLAVCDIRSCLHPLARRRQRTRRPYRNSRRDRAARMAIGRPVNLRRARRRLQWCTGRGLHWPRVLRIRTMTTQLCFSHVPDDDGPRRSSGSYS